jgi:hypothetical protein
MKPQAMTGTAAADAQPDSQVLPSGTPRLPTGKATLPLVHTTPKETAAHHEPACLLTSMHNSRRTPREPLPGVAQFEWRSGGWFLGSSASSVIGR